MIVSDQLKTLLPHCNLIRLTEGYTIKPFDCDNSDLNSFLFSDALRLQRMLLWVTYILEIQEETVAYFSIANDKLIISASDDRDFKSDLRQRYQDSGIFYDLLEQGSFPAVKLGRFAVAKKFKRMGIGSELIDTLKYSLISNNKTGCFYITVDALNTSEAQGFYERNRFEYLTILDFCQTTRTMYYDLLNFGRV